MIDLEGSELFEPVVDADSGVTTYVLRKKVAPVQEAFYFVNESLTRDGRYLWFYCAFPPSGSAAFGRTLARADLETGEVRHFPETLFGEASPYLDIETGTVYWQCDRYVWKRAPEPDAEVEPVGQVPDDLIGARKVIRAATHLTRSADGKQLFIDLGLEMQWIFGSLPLDGGDFEVWHRFDRLYDHAQFSPTDPDEILFAEEFHGDPITGLTFPVTNRLWTMRRGEKPRRILGEPRRGVSHEWWDADGKHVWCVWGDETWRVRLADGAPEKIEFPRYCWHSHSSRDGRLIVGDTHDGFGRGCATGVHFMNRDTGKDVVFIRNPGQDNYAGRNYHIDPHPRFVCDDKYIVMTTTVRGEVDVAIVRVDELAEKTGR